MSTQIGNFGEIHLPSHKDLNLENQHKYFLKLRAAALSF